MALFFRRNFSEELDRLNQRMEELKATLAKAAETSKQQSNGLEVKFTLAQRDLDKVATNYRSAIVNCNSDYQRKKLLKGYEEVIGCLEQISTNSIDHTQVTAQIAELQKSNKNIPGLEALSRVGNALAVAFWLGVFTISIVAMTLSIASIPADPVGGVAFAAVSFGLMGYSYYEMFNNFDAIFEPKQVYQNRLQINSDAMELLKHADEAYQSPVASF
ncbi:hypothetical protein [Legionella hackeliae]|uniref:Uncharacterized protein n=1 Tax=Legionella hackeliae TaxID=449 RepID=A0A0A8UZ60_LEGHA|nr:hypothetical protein [Legionella hackeliae]KTD12628.1 hypothetical protein Lhac_1499 [Legionella hackeliae]CEK12044.1 protein of unknown function [Legionella hackeliae]STX48831.1 Uncharacterised protein [Legionella hackeliae]